MLPYTTELHHYVTIYYVTIMYYYVAIRNLPGCLFRGPDVIWPCGRTDWLTADPRRLFAFLTTYSDSVSWGPSDLCLWCNTTYTHPNHIIEKGQVNLLDTCGVCINSYWQQLLCVRLVTALSFYVNSWHFKGHGQNNMRLVMLWQAEIWVCELPCSFIRFL